ncbi:flagellar filament capping protein FliD [Escherichia coli]
MGDDAFSATGTFELTMGDSTMDIDLSAADQNGDGDGFIDASELVNAINGSADNPGVSAALVKTDGTTTIMLTSDSTGVQSAFSVSVTGHDASNDSTSAPVATDVSSAQDAIIHLGSATGPEITNSSNTFDDVIPGVTMTFTEVSDSDSDLTTFNISEDSSASQEKVQTFVDAYNTLIDTVDSLTTHGDDSTSAGVFAGDAGLSSLANQLDDIAHASYNGVSIVDYGITLDSHGHLQIDSDQFNDEMAKNPDGLTSIFVGDNSMVAQMDDLINTYTDSSNGIITMQSIDGSIALIGLKVAAALVGTFLGVFICYCLMDPLANAMEQQARAEHSLLECVRTVLVAQAGGKPTLLAVDAGRKLLHLASKPTFANLDAWVNAMLEQE